MLKCFTLLFFAVLLFSCESKDADEKNPIAQVLASENPKISGVLANLDQHALQIKFSQVERQSGKVRFKDYDFQVNDESYFYPASTVKFPIALLALAKLNTLEGIDRNTKFYVEGDSVITTFAKEIQKIFAVSDNAAYNRLFEFLGQDYIKTELAKIDIGPVRIAHRLSVPEAHEITAQSLIVYLNDSTTTTLNGSINTTAQPLLLNAIEKGIGFIAEDSLINKPFDFSLKNYYPIATQHQFLKTVMFPELFSEDKKIAVTDEQLKFVQTAMHTLPKNAGYDAEEYYDGYCKFFMFGDSKANIPESIKIYNKVGDAYGTLTDCAYIIDSENDIEFLITATILVNKNGIFNDNTYEFDEIGFPFLAELGREFYANELKRKK